MVFFFLRVSLLCSRSWPKSAYPVFLNFFESLSHCFNHGVISHRAIYFAAYSTAKEKLNGVLEPDSTQVHMVSAGLAGNDGSLSPALLSVCLFNLSILLSVKSACQSAWAV